MREYTSVFAPVIERYILYKRGLGYKFVQAENVYAQFDAFCAERDEASLTVTKELAEAWGRKRANESDPTRYARVHYLIQLASFMNDIGYPSHVPRPPAKYSSTFVPFIFTHSQVSGLFEAIDLLAADARDTPASAASCMPCLLRTLYSTGMRIGEAVALKKRDADVDRKTLTVRWSKNGQERMVPFPDTLQAVFRYHLLHLTPCQMESEMFFSRSDGKQVSGKTAYEWFRKALSRMGISHQGGSKGPRLHDIRHSAAVHALAKMADAGLDLYYSLPVLSVFLGHQSLEATEGYVRLTAEMYPGLISDSNTVCSYVFPEVQ
jgi:integrase